jgi:hypothetical protein
MNTKIRKKATAEEYPPIPQDVLDRGWRAAVHVEGWPASYRFHYRGTTDGVHSIYSVKGEYQTRNRILYTKRYAPTK